MVKQWQMETSNRSYPEIGVPDPHHPTSHHGGDPEKVAKIAKINQFHVSLFAYFLEKLSSIREADGTLLDNSLYLYGSGMGNPNVHSHIDLPIVIAGGAAGKVKGGRHISTPSRRRSRTCISRCSTRWACGSTRSRTAPGRSTRCTARCFWCVRCGRVRWVR